MTTFWKKSYFFFKKNFLNQSLLFILKKIKFIFFLIYEFNFWKCVRQFFNIWLIDEGESQGKTIKHEISDEVVWKIYAFESSIIFMILLLLIDFYLINVY